MQRQLSVRLRKTERRSQELLTHPVVNWCWAPIEWLWSRCLSNRALRINVLLNLLGPQSPFGVWPPHWNFRVAQSIVCVQDVPVRREVLEEHWTLYSIKHACQNMACKTIGFELSFVHCIPSIQRRCSHFLKCYPKAVHDVLARYQQERQCLDWIFSSSVSAYTLDLVLQADRSKKSSFITYSNWQATSK
jgi:hypothetical protein